MITPGPMDLITQGHLFLARARVPIQVHVSQPSTHFLHSIDSNGESQFASSSEGLLIGRRKTKATPTRL